MRILDLPLIGEWYNMIESGIKTEEYREIKPHWCKIFFGCIGGCGNWPHDEDNLCWLHKLSANFNVKNYNHVRFRYGYTKRTMLREIESISIGYGKPEWGAPTDRQVFIIKFKKGDQL